MLRREKNYTLTELEQSPEIPREFYLAQNSPNPFTGQTAISFFIPRPGNVKILVYDNREELQCVLHDNHLKPGYYRLIWKGTDAGQHPLKPGSYNYCLQAAGFFATRKLTIKGFK